MGFELLHNAAADEDGSAKEGAAAQRSAVVDQALIKVGRRLIPLCMCIAISNHMDRSK